MSVVRRRLASQVAAALAVDFRTSLTWRGTVLSFASFALALVAGDAPSQSGGCARCGSAPVAPEAAAPQRTAEPRRMKRMALRFDLRSERPKRGAFGGSYVVCVRACDGSFFPVSYFGVNPSDVQEICQSLCPNATVALYSLPFGGTIDEAVSINGEPYANLSNAHKFEQTFDASCSCRAPGQSWADALAAAEATQAQIQFALRFASGPPRRFAPDEKLLDVGDRNTTVWLVIEGSIVASRRDGLGREGLFATGGPGQFSGEVSDLAGHASLAMVCAGPEGCTAHPFDLPHLRALLISSADIGEVMMRAFILRRAALLEGDSVGSVILGEAGSPETVRLRGLLSRNSYPHSLIDTDGPEGKALVVRLGVQPDDLPILICPSGTMLRRPSDAEAGAGLGIIPDIKPGTEYDVIVVGAGPSGLATPCMQRRRVSPFSFLIAARSGDKPVLRQGSRTIWDFRRAFPGKRLRRAHSFKRRNLALSLQCRCRSSSLIVHSRLCITLRSITGSPSTDERLSSHQVRATGDLTSNISIASREPVFPIGRRRSRRLFVKDATSFLSAEVIRLGRPPSSSRHMRDACIWRFAHPDSMPRCLAI